VWRRRIVHKAPESKRSCNICGSVEFKDFAKRTDAQCTSCSSLERHRVCFDVYQREGLLEAASARRRILQFAPERITHQMLSGVAGTRYICSDLRPEKYPHAEPLRLRLPDDLAIFPDGYFDYLIHNHVWEHLPGDWVDHVQPFLRILRRGGKMIFTFPFSLSWSPETTEQGGEDLPSDADRLRVFGQHDHVRRFGLDFEPILGSMDGCKLTTDGVPDERKRQIGGFVGTWGETVFILERTI
jgi:SAM-dependent methyltransferase